MTPSDYAKELRVQAETNAYVRWRPVFAFYSALHAIDHALPHRTPFKDHYGREQAAQFENDTKSIFGQYMSLKSFSSRMRYYPGDPGPSAADTKRHLYLLDHILKHCKV